MLDGVAYGNREGEEDDLRHGEERSTKDNVANRPTVLESTEDEDELRDDVDDSADKRPKDVDDPQADRLGEVEPGNLLERGDRNEEGYAENDQCRYPQKLHGQFSSNIWQEIMTWLRTHSERGVPSSANWKPTKPLMRRQVYAPATRPV